MAKAKIEHISLVDSFAEFKEFKNIDRITLVNVLEEVFRNILKKKYGTDNNFDIIINDEQGDLEIYRHRIIVDEEEVELPHLQISLSEARKLEEDYELNEETIELVGLEDFGRRAIISARQILLGKITELEKEEVFKKYSERVGEIVSGEVYQIRKRELMVLDDDGHELVLPRNEMIPSDFYKKEDSLKAVVESVEMRNGNPRVVLSRTSPLFLERLFELEVPEILDGLITIKKIVRQPGDRAKIAVESYDDRIDPVGACVGMKGSRIHGIVRELRNENIDVINFTTNMNLYISRSLSPAKINSIKLDDDTMRASVFLNPDQVSLAIGKGGFNIRLAGQLVGYEIDVYRDSPEDEDTDIELEEFSDEIDSWILDELKSIGCDTARDVIQLDTDDLVRRTELEEETIVEIKKILKAEFE